MARLCSRRIELGCYRCCDTTSSQRYGLDGRQLLSAIGKRHRNAPIVASRPLTCLHERRILAVFRARIAATLMKVKSRDVCVTIMQKYDYEIPDRIIQFWGPIWGPF